MQRLRFVNIARAQTRNISSLQAKHLQLATSLQLDEINDGVYHGSWASGQGNINRQIDPSTGETLGFVRFGSVEDYRNTIAAMDAAKADWAAVPAPVRGELVRKLGERLRQQKTELGTIVSLEMGKILAEGLGEVQEAIDICDFSVGLSRSLNGSVIPSERPGHVMLERYNPLKGHVGIISAFNFPVAVYFWNLAISLVCGNTNLWKPHESVSLVAVAVSRLVADVIQEAGYNGAIASMICGTGATVGDALVQDPKMELVSFTGSTPVGRRVGSAVAGRFGKTILELGGNNAMIVDKSADLDMAVRATLFGSVGTAGQRCTSQRRVFLHESIYDAFLSKLLPAYSSVKIGSPLDPTTLCGPLHNKAAVDLFTRTVKEAQEQGGKLLTGGVVLDRPGHFVTPAVVAIPAGTHITLEERFVPVLYISKVKSFEEAVAYNNEVAQGLSSSLFSQDLGQIFAWTGPAGSDCGIVNVNIGTSGAEIGGAFGGQKETGGGRESGSDSWKQYMRRSTITINHSKSLPLAQGINFGHTESISGIIV